MFLSKQLILIAQYRLVLGMNLSRILLAGLVLLKVI